MACEKFKIIEMFIMMKLKKYRQTDERVKRIIGAYNNRASFEYLRGIAYNHN